MTGGTRVGPDPMQAAKPSRRKSKLKKRQTSKSVLETTPAENRMATGVVAAQSRTQSASSSGAAITPVDELRQTLDDLRRRDDTDATKRTVDILLGLDERADVDFGDLFRTGIGKVVNKLAKQQGNGKISKAAASVMRKWRMIDKSTPAAVKAAVKRQATGESKKRSASEASNETETERSGQNTPPEEARATVAKKSAMVDTSGAAVVVAATSPQKHQHQHTPLPSGTAAAIMLTPASEVLATGTRVEVYWPDDAKFYPGVVAAHVPRTVKRGSKEKRGRRKHMYTILYDDGEEETVDLAEENFRLIRETAAAAVPEAPPASKSTIPVSSSNNEMIDLTSSPPLTEVQGDVQKNNVSPSSSKWTANDAAALTAKKVTPHSTRSNIDDARDNEGGKKNTPPMLPPPELASSPSFKEKNGMALSSKMPKRLDEAGSSVRNPTIPPRHSSSTKDQIGKENKAVLPKSSGAPGARAVLTQSKPSPANAAQHPDKTMSDVAKPCNRKFKPTALATVSKAVVSATADSSSDYHHLPKKRKKRSFNDEILYIMLTSCKPYTLKSLAKATKTTVTILKHTMLSLLDKRLVLCKEFSSKKGSDREPKKLYWANPISLSEAQNGGGVVSKELSKLFSPEEEIKEAKELREQLERQLRSVQEELDLLLAIPTMKELGNQVLAEEKALKDTQDQIVAVKDRMANAAKALTASTISRGSVVYGGHGSAAYHPANRFKKPMPKPQSPTTLKRKINHMLSEYKTRKRKCMDFVEELSDAMEKKSKDVLGDKVLGLDTDEMEWGQYEDMSTGKVYGTKRPEKQAFLGAPLRRENGGDEGTEGTVKIPARYKNV